MLKNVLILGSSFAGYAAALELRRSGSPCRITVIAKDDRFVFLPSLVWLPFGLRHAEDITFPLPPVYRGKGIRFVTARVRHIDPVRRMVETTAGAESYDALLIATGPKADYGAVPGLGPYEGFSQGIVTLAEAETAAARFSQFLHDPGPVVVGAAPGAALLSATYEFLFAMGGQLAAHALSRKAAPMTFFTPEPHAGHLGLGDPAIANWVQQRLHAMGIRVIADATLCSVSEKEIVLASGRRLPFRYAMIMPRLVGSDAVRERREFATPEGFVRVNPYYQTDAFPEIFAAGAAVDFPSPPDASAPRELPKTGYFAERSGRVAARNIAAQFTGAPMQPLPPEEIGAKWLLDAGPAGALLSTSGEGVSEWIVPGPEAHWAKAAFERYFVATRRRGAA